MIDFELAAVGAACAVSPAIYVVCCYKEISSITDFYFCNELGTCKLIQF